MSKNYCIVLNLILFYPIFLFSRSIHRKIDPNVGSIEVCYENDDKTHKLQDSLLREFPLFKTYNHEYLEKQRIPDGKIKFLYEPNNSIDGKELKKKAENLLKEIKEGKSEFKDFKILKKRDFNFDLKCGLLILKFKDYPFIFKIFIECPESVVKPNLKSFQERGINYLGGSRRHFMGYTRIKNLEDIQEKIKEHPVWSKRDIKVPKKWFWIPEEPKWIIVKGINLGGKQEQQIRIPAIYGLLCDEIKENNKKNAKVKREYLRLCSDLNFILDPLPANFLLGDKNEIILIDTEHFGVLIGIRKKFKEYDKYPPYWLKVAGKYIKDRFLTTKQERYDVQQCPDCIYKLY